MNAICQGCGREVNAYWTISQASIHVGGLKNWKLQLCAPCQGALAVVIVAKLQSLKPNATQEPT